MNRYLEKIAESADADKYDEYVSGRGDPLGKALAKSYVAGKVGAIGGGIVGTTMYLKSHAPGTPNRFAGGLRAAGRTGLAGSLLLGGASMARKYYKDVRPAAKQRESSQDTPGVADYERRFVSPMVASAGGAIVGHVGMTHLGGGLQNKLNTTVMKNLPIELHAARPLIGRLGASTAVAAAANVAARAINARRSESIRASAYGDRFDERQHK